MGGLVTAQTQAQANELESMYAALPGIVQDLLQEPFLWLDDKLKMVAGSPQELLDAGTQYQQLGYLINGLLVEDRADVAALGRSWTGEAHDAFANRMEDVDATMETLVGCLAAMPQLLQSGADACVEGADMIVELVVALLALALSTMAINLALSVITFGASLAAGAAEVLAEAAATMARVLQVVEKIAQVLAKIAQVLKKIAEVLRMVKTFFQEQQAGLKALQLMSKGVKGTEWLSAKGAFITAKVVLSKEIWAVTGGTVNIPGLAGPLSQAGKDYVHGVLDAGDAGEQAAP